MPVSLQSQNSSLLQIRDAQDCPAGFSWYSCAVNTFQGCCSIDPCAPGVTCPLINQPPSVATASATSTDTTPSSIPPSNTASSDTMASSATPSSNLLSSTPAPTVISSVGPPIGTSVTAITTTVSPTSSQSSSITTIAPSSTVTVVVSQPSNSATSYLSPATPSIGANNGNNNNNNNQGYPIGLIAGIVTGFSILMLVMGVMFVILWRNKRTKVVGDMEGPQVHPQHATARAYYMPPPPAPLQQQQHKTIDSGASTPARSARFPSEPEVMTPGGRIARGSPRRSADVNKPWPPTPRDSRGVMSTSPWPLREGRSIGGENPETTLASGSPRIDYPGRASNIPDPLRAGGLVTPATATHAGPYTSPTTALLQRIQPSSSQSPGDGYRSLSTQDMSPPFTGTTGGPSTANYAQDPHYHSIPLRNLRRPQRLSRNLQRFSELTRADSTHFALRPPPRRKLSSRREAAKSTGEGRIRRTQGLRLSGVSQGTIGPMYERSEDQRESVDEDEADPMLQRATWYGEGKGRAWSDRATPPRNGRRRFSH